MNRLRILLVDWKTRASYYEYLRHHYEADWCEWDDQRQTDVAQLDLALVSDEFRRETALSIPGLQRKGVPVLHIADGILEWHNTWENPRSQTERAGMPLFQPILADKIACLGRSQARILESWGNYGRCETVGVPRFDPLLERHPRAHDGRGTFRVLVSTARNPGFTKSQVQCVRRALDDIESRDGGTVESRRLELSWRVMSDTGGALAPFVARSRLKESLPVALANVDAVIATPSTLMLEAMLVGLPVALLDYNNAPHYVPAAWTVSAPQHLDRVMSELATQVPAKMLYQDTILHDALECRTPAMPRMIALMEGMALIARQCRADGVPLAFPSRLIAVAGGEHQLPEERFDLRALYPGHSVFGQSDVVALQMELGHLRIALDRAREKIRKLSGNHVSRHAWYLQGLSVVRKVWGYTAHDRTATRAQRDE